MANNQHVNKVVYNDSTLIDLTGDTVTPESLLSGYTAHDRSGASINGSVVIPTKISDLQDDVGYLVENDIVNNLTSTDPTKVLGAPQGKALNDKIINLVTKYTYVGTTDSDGDIAILNIIPGRVFVSAIPNRTYGDETYSSWFGAIVGCGLGGRVSVKCVNDNNQKLVSQKVAIDMYFIEGQQLG